MQDNITPIREPWPAKPLPPLTVPFADAYNMTKIQQEIAQLKAIQESAKGLQKETVTKARTEGQKVAKEPPNVPPNTGEMIKYLKKLLALLSKYPGMGQYAAQLSQIAKDYPNLTAQDIANLQKLTTEIPQAIQNLVKQGKIKNSQYIKILQDFRAVIDAMEKGNKGKIGQYEKILAKLQAEIKTQEDVALIAELLAKLKSGKGLTSAEYTKLLGAIDDLANQYGSLDAKGRAQIDTMLSALSGVGIKGKYSLVEYLADIQVYIWTKQYLQQNPNADAKDVQNYIYQKTDELFGKSGNMNNPFFAAFSAAIRKDADQLPYGGKGFTGFPFWKMAGGKMTADPDFWNNENGVGFPFNEGVQKAFDAMDAANTYFTGVGNAAQKEAGALNKAVGALKEADKALGKMSANLSNKIFSAQSLADDFAKTVLSKYMKRQEEYLMALSMLFSVYNMGAADGNAFLSIISGWGNAGSDFDLTQWLEANGGKASLPAAQNKVKGERSKAKDTLDQILKLLKQLRSSLAAAQAKLKQFKPGTDGYKAAQKLIKNIQGNIKDDTQVQADTKKLISTLTTVLNDLIPDGRGSFDFKDHNLWNTLIQGQLKPEENAVVNGSDNPIDPKYKGGLSNIYSDINAQQAEFQSLSQTSMLTLQMKMTEIQQEWTVVSTSLQVLFQSYKTFAQAIYR